MYTLGSKSLVINDASLVTVTGTVMSIPGFGSIDNTDPAYTKVPTTGVAYVPSQIGIGDLVVGKEIAVYWQNVRYIGEGLSNMSSKPQAPLTIIMPTGTASIADAWMAHEEAFGTSELFELVGTNLVSKNAAVNFIETRLRDIIDPTIDVMTSQTGFRYNRFGGVLGAGPTTAIVAGVGNGFEVEESVRTASVDAMDPYSTKSHGSQPVEIDGLYDIYDFTVQVVGPVGDWNIHDHLAQRTPDENVINHPIQLRIYAKQGDASTPIAGF